MSATDTAQAGGTTALLTIVELIVLGAIWGASFLFMRVAASGFWTSAHG